MGLVKDIFSMLTIVAMFMLYGFFVDPEGTGKLLKELGKAIDDFRRWINKI